MWHRALNNSLAAAQYLSYLLAGTLYYLAMGALAGVAGGVSWVGLALVFVPLLLGGYASALTFIMPRGAAALAGVTATPFLLLGLLQLFHEIPPIAPRPAILVVPSTVVIGISILAVIWHEGSVWSHLTTKFGKLAVGVLAASPALYTTWSLGTFLLRLLPQLLHRAT